MGSSMYGFNYDLPKRGNGVSITAIGYFNHGDLHISRMTAASAKKIKRELIEDYGVAPSEIIIEKND